MKAFIFLLAFLAQSFVYAVPEEALTFDFNVRTFKMTRIKEDKLFRAVDLLREVFSSYEFRKRVLNHRYFGRRGFAQNRGLSNHQIYRKILQGMETRYPYRNNAMDVEIELYSDYKSNVIGYTKSRSRRIWMNNKYFNRHSASEVAAHLTHEWLHKLGFDHEKEKCDNRKYSVPYAIGYIVKDLARKYERYDKKRQKER